MKPDSAWDMHFMISSSLRSSAVSGLIGIISPQKDAGKVKVANPDPSFLLVYIVPVCFLVDNTFYVSLSLVFLSISFQIQVLPSGSRDLDPEPGVAEGVFTDSSEA